MDYRGNEHSPNSTNFFEANQGGESMPLPTEQDANRLRNVGVEAISRVAQGNEQFEIVDLEQGASEPAVVETKNEMNVATDTKTGGNARVFSVSEEFTKGDGEITEREIGELKKNPSKGYGAFQADRIAYLQKFGRTFGEEQGAGGRAA